MGKRDMNGGHVEHSEHLLPKSLYFKIFGALMVLTALTVSLAYVDLGQFNIVVALAVAIVKASLVVMFFMHLKYESHLTKVVLGAGVFWLVLLLGIIMDYVTRSWMYTPHLTK
jgi:cytochrome c oxidase subunit IV